MLKCSVLASMLGLLALPSLADLDPPMDQPAQAGAPSEASRAKAAEVLKAAAGHLASLQAFSFEFKSMMRMQADGMRMEYESRYAAKVLRPDRLVATWTGGLPSASFVADATTRTLIMPNAADLGQFRYASEPGAANIADALPDAELLEMLGSGTKGLGSPGLATVFASDPQSLLDAAMPQAEYVGVEETPSGRAHHIRANQEAFTAHLWIAEGPKPVLVRAEISMSMPGASAMPGGMTTAYFTEFSNWNPAASFAPDAFTFKPLPSQKKVASFAALQEPEDEPAPEQPASPETLKGEPAPAFTLKLLAGEEVAPVAIASKGKVVVLDFWATWCPPCRKGLPVLEEVAKSFNPDQVVVYAVNQQEDAGTVEKFIKKTNMGLSVLMDNDGAVGQLYRVSGIPQTVIIGKDGKVHAVHVGFSPSMKQSLTDEIKAALGS